jgi:hypothetical protein
MKLVHWVMLALVALMIAVLGGTSAWYILKGPFHFWSTAINDMPKSSEWANFGVFLGGVAGPALTLVTGIVVALGLILQVDVLKQAFNQAGMTAGHASLIWARQKLDAVLQQPAGAGGRTLQRLVLARAHSLPASLTAEETKALVTLLPELLYWLGPCIEQIGLFKRNQSVHGFTLQHEWRYYGDVLKFVKGHRSLLPGMLPITVDLLGTHYGS